MITGNEEREKLVNMSIKNFRDQTYKYKHLVIINHGSNTYNDGSMFNVTEIHVSKASKTLGDLRNLAFNYVPANGLFCVWDDDDYRSGNFLEFMFDNMTLNGAKGVCITRRLEYNLNNGFAYETMYNRGIVHVLATKHYLVKYDSKDSMEDLKLVSNMKRAYNVHFMYDNDPRMYVRLVHGDNTSRYVNPNKKTFVVTDESSDWKEFPLRPEYKQYIEKVYLPILRV